MGNLIKKIIFALSGFIFFTSVFAQSRPELIYVYDPLCGWCYGFSPVMQKVKDEYADRLNFLIIPGGLSTGERVAPIGVIYEDMQDALPRMEDLIGIPFGESFVKLINEGSYLYNSEPPAKAVCIVKELKPEVAFDFGIDIQNQLFKEGKDLNDVEAYAVLIKRYNLDDSLFTTRFQDPALESRTREEFYKADQLGVDGFPAVFLKKNDKLVKITEGYLTYKKFKKILEKHL